VDAFQVLGLPYDPDLTDAEVRSAYVYRLRAVHPDNGGDHVCAAAVTAAFEAVRWGVRRGELLAAVTVERAAVAVPVGAAGWRARAGGPPRGGGEEEGRGPGGRPGPVRMAELRRRVAASRAEQGLPPFITDEATLARICELLVVMGQRGGPGAGVRDGARQRAPGPAAGAGGRAVAAGPVRVGGSWWVRGWLRVRWGRPGWLVGRVVVAVGVVVVAGVVAGGDPAVWGLGVGALTWLVRTGRWDLAPGVRR
jgi:hypothetical protein